LKNEIILKQQVNAAAIGFVQIALTAKNNRTKPIALAHKEDSRGRFQIIRQTARLLPGKLNFL
jgi:hypothetical protein